MSTTATRLLSRLPLRLTEILAVLAALVVGYGVVDRYEIVGADMPPFVRSVGPGRTAHLSYAEVRVTGVTTAQDLVPTDPDASPLAPAGVFLLVTVALTPTREPTVFTSVWLTDDDDRKLRPSTRSGCPNSPRADTGVTTYALFCFEVPPSLLDQLRLQVARGSDIDNDTRNDDVADLDLGITSRRAAALAATTTAYRVPDTSLAPITLQTVTITRDGG